MNDCRDCGGPVRNGKCQACGYAEPQKFDTSNPNHRRCAYRYYDNQCPLPGTMSETTRAETDSEFYCHHHMEHRDNPKKAAFIYHEILAGRLTGHKGSEVQCLMAEKMAALRESNPELFYLPTTPEETRDYQRMVMGYVRGVTFAAKPLPYEKHKQIAEIKYNEEELLTGVTVKAA
jgi:hypothetical protein